MDAQNRRLSAHDQALGVDTVESDSGSGKPPTRRLSASAKKGVEWYYAVDEDTEEEVGPVPFSSLLSAFESETIDAQSVVWNEGMEDWTPIGEVPGLLKKLGGPS